MITPDMKTRIEQAEYNKKYNIIREGNKVITPLSNPNLGDSFINLISGNDYIFTFKGWKKVIREMSIEA